MHTVNCSRWGVRSGNRRGLCLFGSERFAVILTYDDGLVVQAATVLYKALEENAPAIA